MASIKHILALMEVFTDAATGIESVVRWSRFLKSLPAIRRQTTLSHNFSIVFLGMVVREKLRHQLKIDWQFLLDALFLHDIGEGELARDICFPSKSDEHDLQEYLAFQRLTGKLGKKLGKKLERAFLLQFALKNSSIFPRDARQTMSELAKKYRREALLFACLEHFDYVLYALEQSLRRGNQKIIADVAQRNFPILNDLVKQLPAFKKFWSPIFRQYCLDIAKRADV